MEKIEIIINPDGTTTISVEGVKGEGCMDATADLERALGKVTSDKKTSEYRERPRDGHVRHRGR